MTPAPALGDLIPILPPLIVFAGALAVLALDIPFRAQRSKRLLEAVSVASLVLALLWDLSRGGGSTSGFARAVTDDALATYARCGLAGVGLFTLLLVRRQGAALGLLHGEFYALLLFALGSMMLFAGSRHLMLSFVALETFSLAMYVLAGFNKDWHGNREAALKYFLLGALAAAIFLFGMAMLFGTGASLDLESLSRTYAGLAHGDPRRTLMTAGFLLVIVALAFKAGLAPFHLWVPDVYEGAPTPVTAFFSAGTKIAIFAALLRFSQALPFGEAPFTQVLGLLAVLTLLAGNLGALQQTGLKRLLAYSSIAHSGYALVGLLGKSPLSASSTMTYVLVYAVMNALSFALLSGTEPVAGGEEPRALTLADLHGSGFTRPWLGLALAVAMVSMAGLPPSAGFFAKLGVFQAALDGGQVTWAVIAILNSVLSAAVYLRVLVAVYMKPAERPGISGQGFGYSLGLGTAVCCVLLLVWGVLPSSLALLAAGL